MESHAREFNEIERLIKDDDREGAVRYFLKDFGMTGEELDGFMASESGQSAAEISPTLLVDYKILGNGVTPAALLEKIAAPTLILTFEHGLPAARDAAKYLPNCDISILEAPAHLASPKDITEAIFNFLQR